MFINKKIGCVFVFVCGVCVCVCVCVTFLSPFHLLALARDYVEKT
jgi:hypothetical protein